MVDKQEKGGGGKEEMIRGQEVGAVEGGADGQVVGVSRRVQYKKLRKKQKKQRNRESRRRRRGKEERSQLVGRGSEKDVGLADDEDEGQEEIVFGVEENEELKRLFGEACGRFIGLDHKDGAESGEGEKDADGEEERKESVVSMEDAGERISCTEGVEDFGYDEGRGVSMKLLMEEEEEEEEEEERERRRKFLQEMKSRNNGVAGKLTVKELKEKTKHPELVEIWDTTAEDPEFLVYLKGCQGSVKVPQHWNSKRRYLQGKKGIERPPYKLPHFIESTKIAEIRALILEEESKMTMKQKQRRKIRPKLNRMDIDYQVLHDAFFIHSTKPHLTQFGDLYYEGKEFEFKFKSIRPGRLSQRLKDALGMQPNWPPPWLVRMQKYGPPPSYPNLRVPGVNSQIPNGCEFGFRPGEWGKPPLDDQGKPIWGLLPPLEDEDTNYPGHQKLAKNPLHSSTVDCWGEVEHDQFDDLAGSDNQDQDEHEEVLNQNANGICGGISNTNNSGNNHLHQAENPQEQPGNAQSGPSISATTNPFMFSNSKHPLYTILERKDLIMDNNCIFPSSYTYR